MSQRQTVEFLRRRYALAILHADADTASRLRARLDGILNHAEGPGRRVEPRPDAQAAPAGDGAEQAAPAGSGAAGPGPDRTAPALRLVMPVAGLLEGPRGGRRPGRQDPGTGAP